MLHLTASVLVSASASVCWVAPALAEPEVFSTAGYEADHAAAAAGGKLHLVYATASWCPPCQRMKQTTWVDSGVVSWLREHAVVTAMDVDEQASRARSLRISAMPTMVLFRGDQEIARTVGYQSPQGLTSWLAGAASGTAPAPAPEALGMQGRLGAARELMRSGRLDDATREYLWLWEHMLEHEPAMYGVRLSFMLSDIGELTAAHAPARGSFVGVRDELGRQIETNEAGARAVVDWVHLNGVLGGEGLTAAWAEAALGGEGSSALLNRVRGEVFEQALAAGRTDLVVRLYPDPVASAEAALKRIEDMRAMGAEVGMNEPFSMAHHLGPAVASSLLRDDGGSSEAALTALLDERTGRDEAWRVAFIAAARQVGRLRPEHSAWIEAHGLRERYPEAAGLIGG